MRMPNFALAGAALLALAMPALAHYDVAPYIKDGQLLTGGLDHVGNAIDQTITAYLYDFGEEPSYPFSPDDPGVNQAAGVGNLPPNAVLSYNILSSLTYWDGTGDPQFITPPTGSYLELTIRNNTRTLDEDSGVQTGSVISTISTNPPVHAHFISSLFHHPGVSNDPFDPTYLPPVDGIYAFELELKMTDGGKTYTSNPFWIVFNNGLSEDLHEAAGLALSAVPEPASLATLSCGAAALLIRRRKFRANCG